VLLEVHAFSASFRLREPLPQTQKAVRTLLRGTPGACVRSNALARLPGMHAVFGVRAAAASRKRAPRTMRETEYCASRFRYGTRRSAIGRLQPRRTRAPAARGRPSTAVHARRIIFDIASVFAREPSYNACTALASISPTGM
jgi:hypothetical protein